MDVNRLSSLVSRIFTGLAFLLLIIAGIGKGLQMILPRPSPGETGMNTFEIIQSPRFLLEWAVILLVFVIALLLRQIREGIRSSPGT